ncbi:AraC family transcriptional regulator [Kribbella sp. NPDC048928]|uniref:AraC family transcriptional regulator n=1 Tax=Kribbella sp. NPDC048928 TaxID=3364111 RepID=UPI00371CD7A9
MRPAVFERLETPDQQSWRLFERTGIFTYLWHYHPELEAVLITAGSGSVMVGDRVRPFAVGDVVLVGSNLPHAYVSSTPSRALVCQFPPGLLGAELVERPEFETLRLLLADAETGVAIPGCGEDSWSVLRHDDAARRTVGLLGLLVELAGTTPRERLASAGYTPLPDQKSLDRLQAILDHLAANLPQRVSLAELGRVAALSPSATSRFFRRQTGITISEHVNRSRIANVCRLLADSDDSVASIAGASGYPNLAHFNREFRRQTGRTPREFRRRRQGTLQGPRQGSRQGSREGPRQG